jgi:hypothetical protein
MARGPLAFEALKRAVIHRVRSRRPDPLDIRCEVEKDVHSYDDILRLSINGKCAEAMLPYDWQLTAGRTEIPAIVDLLIDECYPLEIL